jgi:pilus assembly protein CpaE
MSRLKDSSTALLSDSLNSPAARPAPDDEPAASAGLTVAIAGADRMSNGALGAMVQETGLAKKVEEWAWLNTVKLRNAQDVPDVVFLDLSSGMGSEFLFAQELSRLRPAVTIIACSNRNETNAEFLLQAMRSGIRDFLQKPFNRIEVQSLMRRLGEQCEVQPEKKTGSGKLFVVLGTKGGVGTTTVAVNLAVQMARLSGKRALLLDFSRPMGDVAALLDLKPSFQIRDALENVKRLDSTMFAGLLTPHKSGLKVLAGAALLEDWQEATAATIERILEIAQQEFDLVVMDLGAFYSPDWRNVLYRSEVLLISEADLPGLAKLHKHLGALGNLRVDLSRVRLVINRWHRQDEEALKKIESTMRLPVFARLPNSFKEVTEATVRGVPVARSGDPLAAGFEKIAMGLAGTERSGRQKKSLLGQFFSA